MCQGRGGGRPFLCPEGTKFNQRTFVCDHARRVKCSEASNFFHRNVIVHEASIKAIPKSSKNHFRGLSRAYGYSRDFNCCVFRPAFRSCVYPKAGRNTVFVHLKCFSVIFCLKSRKNIQKSLKKKN